MTLVPSTSRVTFVVATRSPGFRPLVISTRVSTVWPVVTIRSSTWSPLTTKTWLVPALVCTAPAGTRIAGVGFGCWTRAVAKKPGLSSFFGLGTSASAVSARWSA